MMSRIEIKESAKTIVKGSYSLTLLPYLLYILLSAFAGGISFGLGLLLILPLAVGMQLVYISLWKREKVSVDVMFTSAFQENFGRKLCGMLLMELYTFLWSLLFVIPGIVKSYSYAATQYILAKYPNITADNAIKLSMRVMNGRKLDLFIFDLSYIGWQLLGALTFGILNIFWVYPYYYTARAGFIDEVIADAVENGRVDASELA